MHAINQRKHPRSEQPGDAGPPMPTRAGRLEPATCKCDLQPGLAQPAEHRRSVLEGLLLVTGAGIHQMPGLVMDTLKGDSSSSIQAYICYSYCIHYIHTHSF
jgi:hypothetical protein